MGRRLWRRQLLRKSRLPPILLVYNGSSYLHGVLCEFVGYSGYFLTMSMFCWMTIMSFDLCWTFKRAKVPSKDAAVQKFLIYSFVAWGASATMTLTIILADLVMDGHGMTVKDGQMPGVILYLSAHSSERTSLIKCNKRDGPAGSSPKQIGPSSTIENKPSCLLSMP